MQNIPKFRFKELEREDTCCIVQDPDIAIPFWSLMGSFFGCVVGALAGTYACSSTNIPCIRMDDNTTYCPPSYGVMQCASLPIVIGGGAMSYATYKIAQRIFFGNSGSSSSSHLEDATKRV